MNDTVLRLEFEKFSVAMSVYKKDNPKFLRIALDSICNQSCQPSEIYLVIDGPIGKSLMDIINEYKNKYDFFMIHQLPENKGLGVALKIAVENCKYDLVARMDSDDICAPGRFYKQLKAHKDFPADVIGGWVLGFDASFNNSEFSLGKKKLTNESLYKELKHKSPMSHVTVMFRKSSILKAGNYKDLFYHEDYYLWARMMNNGFIFRNIPEYLVYVRFGREQAKRHGGFRYFKSEVYLRKYLLNNHLTTRIEFYKEIIIRFIYQIILPSSIRNFLALKINRKKISKVQANNIIQSNLDFENEIISNQQP